MIKISIKMKPTQKSRKLAVSIIDHEKYIDSEWNLLQRRKKSSSNHLLIPIKKLENLNIGSNQSNLGGLPFNSILGDNPRTTTTPFHTKKHSNFNKKSANVSYGSKIDDVNLNFIVNSK